MKDFKIFIFLMAVCTLCFCSLNLDAQETGKTTIRSLTHRDWIWQCSDNMFIYMHLIKRLLLQQCIVVAVGVGGLILIFQINIIVFTPSLILIIFQTLFLPFLNMIKLIIRNEGTIWCYLQEELLCHLFLR